MRIYPEQLTQRLNKELVQAYLLFGNEPLLKQEAIQAILTKAQQKGFSETHRFTINAELQWHQIYDICQSMSLFAAQQVILLTFPETPLNVTQLNALKEITPLLHQDIILVLEGPKPSKQQENAKWFKQFLQMGTYVQCNTPDAKYLPAFIQKRCQGLGLKPDTESIQLLALYHEGNLLALAQTLLKLQLLFPDGHLTLPRLEKVLSAHAHFTPFQLIDALLEAKPKRALRILRQLEAEGIEITLLLRLIQKELVQLAKLQSAMARGIPLYAAFDEYRIWQNRRQSLTQTLGRLPAPQLANLIKKLAKIEVMTKTDFNAHPWLSLSSLCLEFCTASLNLSYFE